MACEDRPCSGGLLAYDNEGRPFAKVRFVQRLAVGCKNRALLGGDDQVDLHALAATAPPTAARRDEGENISCGEFFVKVLRIEGAAGPLRLLSGFLLN